MIGWIKNLFKDSLVYGIGFGISRFLQIIVLPIIAHALTLSEFGYYSNYVIFYTIAAGVVVLGLDSSAARFIFDSEEKKHHRKVFSIAFFCVLLVSLLTVGVASLFPDLLLSVISVPGAHGDSLPFVLMTIPVLALNNFFLSWFKWKRQKFHFLANTIGTVLFLLGPLLIAEEIRFQFIFQVIFFSQLSVAVISTMLASGYIRFVFDKHLFISMLKYGFPWMLVFFLGLSRSYLDRFFLTHYLNDDNLYGVYNFSVRLSTLLSLVITAFDMSFGPMAFSIWNKEGASRFFARLQSAYIFFIGAVACMIVIISPLLVNILGGQKYEGAERILPYLLFSAIPLSLINFSSLGIIYAKKSFLSTLTLMIGFSAVLVLNAVLTPRFLQFGAVNASLAGHLLIVITGYYYSRRFYKIDFHFKKDALLFLFLFAFSVLLVEMRWSNHMWTDMILKTIALLIVVTTLLISVFRAEYKRSLIFLKNIQYAGFRSNARI